MTAMRGRKKNLGLKLARKYKRKVFPITFKWNLHNLAFDCKKYSLVKISLDTA